MLRFLRYLEQGCGVESLREVTTGARAGLRPRAFERRPSRRAECGDLASASLGGPAVVPECCARRRSSITIRRWIWSCRRVRRCAARPLTDDEIALGRSFSFKTLRETRQPAAWALAEATVRTSELAGDPVARSRSRGRAGLDRWEHEDRAAVGYARRRGASRRSLGASTSIGRSAPDDAASSTRATGSLESRQASSLRCDLGDAAPRRSGRRARCAAGLGRGVGGHRRSSSETGRIEAVARALGVRSLDRAAAPDRLGLDDTRRLRRDEATVAAASPRSSVSRRCSPTRRSTSSPTSSPTPTGRGRPPPRLPGVHVAALRGAHQRLRQRPPGRSRTRPPARLEPHPHDRSGGGSRPTRPAAAASGRCAATTTSTPATATSPTPTSSPRSPTLHRELAADQARELGLLDPDGPGSWTHPDLSRMLHADGKVITPLFKAQPGDHRVDRTTGETPPDPRTNPTPRLHFEGDGNAAWGTKFVLVAARTDRRPRPHHPRRRMGPHPRRRSPHRHRLLHPPRTPRPRRAGRHLRHRPARRPPPAPAPRPRPPAHQPRHRRQGQRQDSRAATTGASRRASTSKTRPSPSPTARRRTRPALRPRRRARHRRTHRHRRPRTSSHSPASAPTATATRTAGTAGTTTTSSPTATATGTITVRLHGNDDDTARKLNRTENLRPIPPGDPDFERLFPRRNDAESINRHLDDTLWLGRAHSIGHARQHLNLLGFALIVNALALHRHRRRPSTGRSPPEPPRHRHTSGEPTRPNRRDADASPRPAAHRRTRRPNAHSLYPEQPGAEVFYH